MDWSTFLREWGLPLTMLAIVTWAFVTGRVVPRWVHDREVARGNRWEDRFDMAMGIGRKTLDVVTPSRDA